MASLGQRRWENMLLGSVDPRVWLRLGLPAYANMLRGDSRARGSSFNGTGKDRQ
ncbi:MAG: hypothetical protein ACRDST_22905 [Pseudonocardiaceae bacterium]